MLSASFIQIGDKNFFAIKNGAVLSPLIPMLKMTKYNLSIQMYLLYHFQTTLFDNTYLRYSLKGQPYPSPNIIFFCIFDIRFEFLVKFWFRGYISLKNCKSAQWDRQKSPKLGIGFNTLEKKKPVKVGP